MKKAIFASMALVLCAAMLAGCSGGEKLVIPTYAKLQSITIQEYEGGNAVSREVPLDDTVSFWKSMQSDLTYFSTEDYRRIEKESQLPSVEKSMLCRFDQTDGTVRTFRVYSDEKYNYIEEFGVGVWREKREKGYTSVYDSTYHTYEVTSYRQAYAKGTDGKDFTLLPEYNGSGKAIWLDLTEEGSDHWIDRYIPEERVAKRAEDVRYIVMQEVVEQDYRGYWYVPETGQVLGDAYDYTYRASVYDLVSGETTILINATKNIFDIPDSIDAFFSEIE